MALAGAEKDIIYDRFGAARLRVLSNNRIVSWGGAHVGFLRGALIYDYNGRHIGWYEKGIMRDLNGATVGFGLEPTDAPRPYLPYRQYLPYRGYINYAPSYIPQLNPPSYRPYKQYVWSNTDLLSLFGIQE